MKFVDYDEVLAEAIATMGANGDDELAKNFARQWIWRGLQKLGTSDDQLTVVRVYVKELLIKKPSDMRRLDEIALYDSRDCFIPHVFHSGAKRMYPNTEQYVLNEGEVNEVIYGPVDLSENKNSFVLGTNGRDVSYALIRYWAVPLDENDNPLIQECEVEALSLYVRWRWSQRKNENQSEIQANKVAWMEAADWTIAHKKSLDNNGEIKKRQAADLNRFVGNYNRSRF